MLLFVAKKRDNSPRLLLRSVLRTNLAYPDTQIACQRLLFTPIAIGRVEDGGVGDPGP